MREKQRTQQKLWLEQASIMDCAKRCQACGIEFGKRVISLTSLLETADSGSEMYQKSKLSSFRKQRLVSAARLHGCSPEDTDGQSSFISFHKQMSAELFSPVEVSI
jgi:hypothetical protein